MSRKREINSVYTIVISFETKAKEKETKSNFGLLIYNLRFSIYSLKKTKIDKKEKRIINQSVFIFLFVFYNLRVVIIYYFEDKPDRKKD